MLRSCGVLGRYHSATRLGTSLCLPSRTGWSVLLSWFVPQTKTGPPVSPGVRQMSAKAKPRAVSGSGRSSGTSMARKPPAEPPTRPLIAGPPSGRTVTR
jgi:hypothetical protein